MTNLATLIDQLQPPQLPDHYSEDERQMVLLALASAKQQVRPYDGKFEAPWLLCPFESSVWETANRGREELVDGTWRNTIRIDWCVRLPNGTLLTDARNELLLLLAKKIAFLGRCNLIAGSSAPKSWKVDVLELISTIRWVVLHEERFQPEKYGLRLLDQPAIEWLLGLIADGGWSHALQIPQRILATIYRGAHGVGCPQKLLDNPWGIPPEEIGPLVKWLELQGGYKRVKNGAHYGKRQIRRGLLATLIHEPHQFSQGLNVTRFLRQFEPEFRDETLLITSRQLTEFPSQKTKSTLGSKIDSASEGTVNQATFLIATILDAHRHVPDLVPEPANISIRRAQSLANRVSRSGSHTLFMPVNTGLVYLNNAMRFVHVYGDAIVGFYLSVMSHYSNIDPHNANVRLNRFLKSHLNDWRIASGETIASVLNITEFRLVQGKPDFERLRMNPTLDESLRVLIGACIICMAILKPSREEELTHLKRSCVRVYAGGNWINFDLGKSNTGGAWQDSDRPIPTIAATAIHLLQRLGDGLSKLFAENRKFGDNLFYLPKAEGFGALTASSKLLNDHLNIFCDFVGLPADIEGRRWYVRIHEMRKWFLLLLFWSGRFDVLDAARWIAGHIDAEHVYAYIEREFPGEELPQIEAEYAIDRVYQRDQERKRIQGGTGNEDGVDALYEAVLLHFNAESLTMVPEAEWTGYVQSLRKDEKFHLEPHSVFGENGRDVIGINVSFVMRQLA